MDEMGLSSLDIFPCMKHNTQHISHDSMQLGHITRAHNKKGMHCTAQ